MRWFSLDLVLSLDYDSVRQHFYDYNEVLRLCGVFQRGLAINGSMDGNMGIPRRCRMICYRHEYWVFSGFNSGYLFNCLPPYTGLFVAIDHDMSCLVI
jgi:hypothetical protein